MSEMLSTAFLSNHERTKLQKKILAELTLERKQIQREIIDYFIQTGEKGIRIDEDTVIEIHQFDKKITRNKKSYRNYLEDLCEQQGLAKEEMADAILAGKVESTIQQSKIKLVTTKKSKR